MIRGSVSLLARFIPVNRRHIRQFYIVIFDRSSTLSATESRRSDIPKELQQIIEAEEENFPELQRFANKHDVIMLAFISSLVPRRYNPITAQRASMHPIDEFGIETAITEIKKKIPNLKRKKLYLLVNSSGGYVGSAYKTASAIRDTFDDITTFVPHHALSGGTLLALTGNRIRMGMMSQLSALDVQVPYKDTFVSVNSLFRARNKLNNEFRTKTEFEVPYPYRHLVEQLDPIIIEEWTGAQDESAYYLNEILTKSKYQNSKTDQIKAYLLFNLPTHGFVISYKHAKNIGINVEPHDSDYEAWKLMRAWLSRYLAKESDRHFIRYIIPNKKKNQKKITKKKITKKKIIKK